jgi:DNA-binding CsgD family transcriptional regulator
VTRPPLDVVGRDAELAAIASFLDEERGSVLLLEGEAGAGKTTLVGAATELAAGRGRRVLRAAPGEREQQLAYAALADLLGAAVGDLADGLAPPRRDALEVALMLTAPGAEPPDALAVGLATADALAALVAGGPVVLVVDDVQWLDTASGDALAFAFRRVRGPGLHVVLSRRGGGPGEPPLGLRPDDVRVLTVGPLSIGALHRLLLDRTGRSYPRPLLHRLHEDSGGNPFFALELALAVDRRGDAHALGGPLPLPPTLGELVRERLAALPAESRRAVAAAALARSPAAAALGDALAPAVAAGVVDLEQGVVRFTHPLLRAAAAELPDDGEARALHAELALAVRDPEERARHFALACERPDDAVAATAEAAAATAAARGAHADAAELLELAVRLTPRPGGTDGRRRRARAAAELTAAGLWRPARELLEALVAELPAGPERAQALSLLANVREDDLLAYRDLLEQALEEAEGDSRLAASIATELAFLLVNFGEIGAARARARELAEGSDDPQALAAALLLDALVGAPVDERLAERALAAERAGPPQTGGYPPTLALGLARMYADRLDEARGLIHEALAPAGAPAAREGLWLFVAELECRAGRYGEAEAAAARALAFAEQLGLEHSLSYTHYASALVDAHLGRAEEARRKAERAVELARASNEWVFELQGLATLGFLELSLGRPAAAAALLAPAAERLHAAGARDPSVWVGALPNAIEALVATGELERARTLLADLDEQAAALEGPWARARAERCHGLLAAAEGRSEDAFAALARALAEPEVPLERARTLLALGVSRRRAKQKRPAREALEDAIAAFDELGATAWAQRAREELARVGGRRASPDGLSATERRVADLVAAGRSNKEVAAELFLSVKAVEANLSRVYRKLGVRTRTELAARARQT